MMAYQSSYFDRSQDGEVKDGDIFYILPDTYGFLVKIHTNNTPSPSALKKRSATEVWGIQDTKIKDSFYPGNS